MPNSKPPKEVLKDVVKKPKELAHWLKKNKFGSADNIPKEGAWSEGESVGRESTPLHQRNHGHKRTQSGHVGGNWASGIVKHTSASLPREGHAGSGGGSVGGSGGHGRGQHMGVEGSVGDSGESDVTSESEPHVALEPGHAPGPQQLPIPVHVTQGGDAGSRRPSGVNIADRDPGVGGQPQPWLQSIMDEIHER